MSVWKEVGNADTGTDGDGCPCVTGWVKFELGKRKDFSLIIIECPACQYHMGVDFTYLDQVGPVDTLCPACGEKCFVPEVGDENDYDLAEG